MIPTYNNTTLVQSVKHTLKRRKVTGSNPVGGTPQEGRATKYRRGVT